MPSASNAIEVEGLRKQFAVGLGIRKRVGLDGMSFAVKAGEIYGFLGPNGAGKTTSIKIITSLLKPDSGAAHIFGAEPASPAARARMGFLPESPVFYEHLTGTEFLHFCGALCGMSGPALKKRAADLLERVGLSHARDLQIRRYSKGMTQRVGIAQALLHDPELVILDEPMSGLDPMGRTDVRDIILELKKQGKTIFFSTHIIPDVEMICTRVGIVNRGKLAREGTVGELLREGSSGVTEIVAEAVPATFAEGEGFSRSALSESRTLFVVQKPEAVSPLVAELLRQGARIVTLTPRQLSLEDLVVKLIDRTGE